MDITGTVQTHNEFWDAFVTNVGALPDVSRTRSIATTDKAGGKVGGGLNLGPVHAHAEGYSGRKEEDATSQSNERRVSYAVVGPKILTEKRIPLVVDDFHYLKPDVQLTIIRSLKAPIFNGVPVVLLSVPHRAFDAVRVEREMTGRVAQLPIIPWDLPELETIAEKGFPQLNAQMSAEAISLLARQSFASPHLMQDFCGALCRLNGIHETCATPTTIPPPASWDQFFKARASEAAKSAFDRLARGSRQRKDRIARTLRNGKQCDIYVAVLLAIAKTGPATEITYETIRSALREILSSEVPVSHEVTRVLEKMSEIARTIEGEPVVDWDRDNTTLHVADPFFAYYLRWGTEIP